jgi:hypothetical protein
MTVAEISVLPPEDFSRELWRLYRKALPDPNDPALFNGLMREAGAQGMRYVEGLLHVIRHRDDSRDFAGD